MTREEVNNEAGKLNDISLDYHLTHAVLACDKMLEAAYKNAGQKERTRIKAALQKAYQKKDKAGIKKLMEEKNSLKTIKYHVFVDYIDMDDPEAGRVIQAEDKLIISLPKKFAENTRDVDGSFNNASVSKLRKTMAHELGHIVLHTDKLLSIKDRVGSKQIEGQQEQEANWFADELLRLRHIRNEMLKEVV